MRRWAEVGLVLAVVAVAVRLVLPPATSQVPPPASASDLLGGYRTVGSSLVRDGSVLFGAGASRQNVKKALGDPVAYNSEGVMWGYWTRGLPNPKMGILIGFDKDNKVQRIELAEDWSRLAAELAQPCQ